MFNRLKISKETDVWYLLAFFFILAFSYFYCFGGYLLFFQEQQSLFLYDSAYFHDFLIRPGGFLDLSGKFLTQFYFSKFAGSVILAVVLTLPAVVLLHINRKLIPGAGFSNILLLIPSCIMLLMQTHYYHLMMYNLGLLFALLYFLLSVLSDKKAIRYLVLVLFPFFYYLTGSYALIFLCLYILYNLLYIKGPRKFYLSIFLLSVAALSLILFKKVFLVQSISQLFLFPFPFINDTTHKALFYSLTGYVILYPALCRLSGLVKLKKLKIRLVCLVLPVIVFSLTIVMLLTGYNSQTARVINLEKLAFEEKWNELIEYQEKYPSENMIGQYFYNVALSETDQLCDRLFYGRQDFGTGSLFLEWSSEHINWGAYSFYATGLINEAQRWAYEEMVVYGRCPQNMKLLTKTSLITGNYRMAKKYTGILGKTLFYRAWSKKYERMAADTSIIRSDPELGIKLKTLPGDDFFIHLESPEANLPLLVDENPENRRAFEYLMSWLLLGKNVDILVNNVRLMKNMGYTRIPLHIEEAILIYFNSQGKFPDLGGLTISNETRLRFNQYFTTYVQSRQNPATLREKMEKQFGNTFWYYFHFK